MERMRYEVARELGLSGAMDADFGRDTTAMCGKFGQVLYARARALLREGHHGAPGGRDPQA